MADPVFDGDTDFLQGQDASKNPDNVNQNGYFSGINVSTENGSLSPRWGWHRRKLDFSFTGTFRLPNLKSKTYEELFYSGKFQALIPYSVGLNYYLIWVISGVIFLIDQVTYQVTILNIEGGGHLNENTNRLYWNEATKYLFIFDYPNLPVIIEGVRARRSDRSKNELPVAVLGGYNSNREFIVNAGNEFTAGDPAGLRGVPNANPPLSFLEIETPGSDFYGDVYQVSTNFNNDPVTALAFLQVTDRSTDIGPLLLATKTALWSYMVLNPRASWKQGDFGSILLYNAGIVGARSYTNINSDFFFMSDDGEVRSLAMSRDEQQKWSKASMSRPVKNWIKFWEKRLKEFSVLSYFKNKIFITVNPYSVAATSRIGLPVSDYVHGGLVVYEVDNLETGASHGVWAGLWTGVRPMDMCSNGGRFFVASKDADNRNYLYEMDPETTWDSIDNKERLVRARIYTREYDFKLPMADKKLSGLEFNIQKILGQTEINIKYRPSHSELYANWRESWKHTAPDSTTKVPTPDQLNGFGGHSFKRLNFGSPEDTDAYNPVTEDSFEQVRKVQLMVDITAKYWELNQIMLTATPTQADSKEQVASDEFKQIALPVEIYDDWAIPGET